MHFRPYTRRRVDFTGDSSYTRRSVGLAIFAILRFLCFLRFFAIFVIFAIFAIFESLCSSDALLRPKSDVTARERASELPPDSR